MLAIVLSVLAAVLVSSEPCHGRGTYLPAEQSCLCEDGFVGTDCRFSTAILVNCSFDHSRQQTRTCEPGLTGDDCVVDIDECASDPCFNGGTCLDSVNGFACVCVPGYSGALCQTQIDECASTPCQHGGTCVDDVNGLVCLCPPGWSGLVCDGQVDECASAPCQNAATCQDQLSGYSCSCATGFSGLRCETAIDECASAPCQNGGTCVDGAASFVCTCATGYSGLLCQTDIDECASNPCSNSGTCIDGLPGYTCTCATGYSGSHCQTNIDECASAPCQNGGTCVDSVNGFACSCPPGYSGVTCQTEIDECASSPCANGGTCTDALNGYACACDAVFVPGQDCSVRYEFCSGGYARVPDTEFVDVPLTSSVSPLDGEHAIAFWTRLYANHSEAAYANGYARQLDYNGAYVYLRADAYGPGAHLVWHGSVSGCTSTATFDSTKWQFIVMNQDLTTGSTDIYLNGVLVLDDCVPQTESGAQFGYQTHRLLAGTDTDEISQFNFILLTVQQIQDLYAERALSQAFIDNYRASHFVCSTELNCDEFEFYCLAGDSQHGHCVGTSCESAPCTNGGTCMGSYPTVDYSCVCAQGFRGTQCELVDECASSPCQNGGNCTDADGGYTCACPTGYGGPYCHAVTLHFNPADTHPGQPFYTRSALVVTRESTTNFGTDEYFFLFVRAVIGAGTRTLNVTDSQTTLVAAPIYAAGGAAVGTAYVILRRSSDDVILHCYFENGAYTNNKQITLSGGATGPTVEARCGCAFARTGSDRVAVSGWINEQFGASSVTGFATQTVSWDNGYVSNLTIADGWLGPSVATLRRQYSDSIQQVQMLYDGNPAVSNEVDWDDLDQGNFPLTVNSDAVRDVKIDSVLLTEGTAPTLADTAATADTILQFSEGNAPYAAACAASVDTGAILS